MNGMTEPLPGLLDDPQFQITDLPALTDFHIAPLRNPAPARHGNVPSPLEPLADNLLHSTRNGKNQKPVDGSNEKKRAPKITPNDVLLAREAKKPHLAISELVDANNQIAPMQLPSFISLSVVEKSPIQAPSSLEPVSKRARLDDNDHISLDLVRRLPRPAQKDDRQSRPAPLLPAMVTGLHEPPPSAALLPSIDVDSRPTLSRSTTSKIHVKDILTEPDNVGATASTSRSVVRNQKEVEQTIEAGPSSQPSKPQTLNEAVAPPATSDDKKQVRRPRRRWSDNETMDLLAGVRKYGVGKWKQILVDPDFNFVGRSSVDLKDRYRVCAANNNIAKYGPSPRRSPSATDLSAASAPGGIARDSASPEHILPTSPPASLEQPQRQRRRRRVWTDYEDSNLLKGVARHGFQWTAIHDDRDLDLGHRKATDLRDRIRNRFPDGYKHAETAPLRSEVKKAAQRQEHPSAVATGMESTSAAAPKKTPEPRSKAAIILPVSTGGTSTWARTADGQPHRSISNTTLAMLLRDDSDGEVAEPRDKAEKERDRDREQPGVTLPSFTLGVDDMDWGNNTLPPLHEWDEIGI
ncbi:hypothetical protein PV08_05238 [Exophiala spinifera]|uniref:Myb-like domain-containing protein n=1 Tax=Exophiala spinifera TaxID=91928 RepID=A0A0D2B8E0_9EURO|nr:uncharacterized protein PV08_05238 [Exophiala spinifera]KIW15193.1 hypothetical protein PV08_05238 [Exophiala spinifera]